MLIMVDRKVSPNSNQLSIVPKNSKTLKLKLICKAYLNEKEKKKNNMAATQFDATLMLSNATQKACGQIATDFSVGVVHALAEKFGFDAESAIRDLGLDQISVKRATKAKKAKAPKEVKPPRDVPKVLLPWTGKPLEGDFCHGLRLNHGLHSQCTMAKCEGGIYCKTCQRQADKNATGKPTYGDIETRAAAGILDYRDPKDNKLTIPYANVMEKLGVTREQVEAEASRFGLEIPEEHFVKREAKRGRPATKPTADSDGSDTAPKKRGRPKKEKKVIESSVGDDLIASLVAQSKASANSDSGDEKPAVVIKPKVAKPKKPKLTEEEKAAKKAAAAEKRKQAAAAKKAEKLKAKKEAELAAMKAKMLAMQKEMEEAAAKLTNAETSEEKPKSPSPNAELQTEEITELVVKTPSPVVDTMQAKVEAAEKQLKANDAKIAALEKEHAELKSKAETSAEKPPSPLLEICVDAKASANSETGDNYGAETDDAESDDDEEEIKVTKFEHGGKTYLKASDNMLYDPSTSECVGCWNPATEQIEEVAEFGSDDESDDEEE